MNVWEYLELYGDYGLGEHGERISPECVMQKHAVLPWLWSRANDERISRRVRGNLRRRAQTRLSDAQVGDILSRPHAKGVVLAAEYGVSPALICRLRKGTANRRGSR